MRETWGSIPGLGRSPGEGKGYPLQYSGLENAMDYTVLGVTMIRTRLSNFHFHFKPPKGKFLWRESEMSQGAQSFWGPLRVPGQMGDSHNGWTRTREDEASQGHKEWEVEML